MPPDERLDGRQQREHAQESEGDRVLRTSAGRFAHRTSLPSIRRIASRDWSRSSSVGVGRRVTVGRQVDPSGAARVPVEPSTDQRRDLGAQDGGAATVEVDRIGEDPAVVAGVAAVDHDEVRELRLERPHERLIGGLETALLARVCQAGLRVGMSQKTGISRDAASARNRRR